jgi:hypothetical protein
MMTSLPQKLATCLLLAVYGGIAVLGHGLHELSPAHHHHAGHEHSAGGGCAHHHHGHTHSHGTAHSLAHHGHSHCDDRDQAFASAHGSFTDGHGHVCEICDFLDQNRSFQLELPADLSSQPLTVAVSIATPCIESLTVPGLYSPRGPPALLG